MTTSSPCLQVQEILHAAHGERFRPPALLKQRVYAGYPRQPRLAQEQ